MIIKILKADKQNNDKVVCLFSIEIPIEKDLNMTINGIKAIKGEKGIFYCLPNESKYDFEKRQPVVDENGRRVYTPIVSMDARAFNDAMHAAVKVFSENEKSKEQVPIFKTPMPKAQPWDDLPF